MGYGVSSNSIDFTTNIEGQWPYHIFVQILKLSNIEPSQYLMGDRLGTLSADGFPFI